MARGGRGGGGGGGQGGQSGRSGRGVAKGPQVGVRGGRGAGQQHGPDGSKHDGGAQQVGSQAKSRLAKQQRQQQQQHRPSPAAAAAAKKFMTGDFVMTIDDDVDVPAFDAEDGVNGVDAPALAKTPKDKRAKTKAAGGADEGGDIDPTFSFATDATLNIGWDLSSVLDRVAAKVSSNKVRPVSHHIYLVRKGCEQG